MNGGPYGCPPHARTDKAIKPFNVTRENLDREDEEERVGEGRQVRGRRRKREKARERESKRKRERDIERERDGGRARKTPEADKRERDALVFFAGAFLARGALLSATYRSAAAGASLF